MDPRLRSAVDASVGWYDDICALHGVGSILADGIWSALDTPPPLDSDAVVVEPAATADQVLVRLNGRAHCGVKDSFARMDLSGEGMDLLFSATWIYREVGHWQERSAPPGWAAVTTAGELAEWTGQHDTSDVLLPPLLQRAHFRILAKYIDNRIVAGAVARLGSGTVDVSNVLCRTRAPDDLGGTRRGDRCVFPGSASCRLRARGRSQRSTRWRFVPTGELRVWFR